MAKRKKRFFPHMHAHDDFSLRDGCSTVETYADNVVALGGTSLCVTNHGQAGGFARQYFACKDRGIKSIFGMEAYVNEHRHSTVREEIAQLKKDDKAKKMGAGDKLAAASAFLKEKFKPSPHSIILAKNAEGYKNLVRMSTDSWLNGHYYKPRTDTKFLAEHAGGLIYSTACIGGYIPQMARNNYRRAVKEARRLQRIFESGFYVELMAIEYAAQRETNEIMMKLAHEINAPMIVTCDVHYSKPQDSEAQDVLLLMRDKKTIADKVADPDRVWQFESKDLWWRSLEDVVKTWKEFHSDYWDKELFLDAIRNTLDLAEEIEDAEWDLSLKLPKVFDQPEAMLREKCKAGMRRRLQSGQLTRGRNREYGDRLKRELGVINDKGFAEYFLILDDIVENARRLGARVGPGRGSAAGSLVAYLLQITQIDPLKYDLLFERFLDRNRPDPPDIDMDFDPEHRDAVKSYVEDRYPATATIGSFGTFKPKATLKDVGRVFGVDYRETEKLTKLIQGNEADDMTWDQVLEMWPGIQGWADAHPEAFEVCKTLRGLNSFASKNAAGMLIAPESALDMIPLMVSKNKKGGKMTVTAFPDPQGDGVKYKGRELTRCGLLKMDLLSVNSVNIAPLAVEILERDHGATVDLDNLPLDDEDTLAMAASADVPGVFQLDTGASRPLLRKVGVDTFMDLVMITALVRPGPREHGIHNKFAKLKRTGDAWKDGIPAALQEVLQDSRGLMILQEDIMWVVQILAGWSFEEANALRSAISKKQTEVIKTKLNARFFSGGLEQGRTQEELDTIWEKILTFGDYGFCKAHAVAYMVTAYQQLYMLAHHPVCYFASLLTTTERKKKNRGEEGLVLQMRSAMGRGIAIYPPDLARGARARFDVVDGKIHYGLRKIKGIGDGAAELLESLGPMETLEELFEEVTLRKCRRTISAGVMEKLILAGAMDHMDLLLHEGEESIEVEDGVEARNALLERLHQLLKKGPHDHIGELTLLKREREALGIAFSWWASKDKDYLREEYGLQSIAEAKADDWDTFGLLVEITRSYEYKSKKGPMGFLTLADETGTLENITIWTAQWREYRNVLKKDRIVVIHLSREEDRRDGKKWSYRLRTRYTQLPVESAMQILRRRG